MCESIRLSLGQVMPCHLFGAKPLYKPVLNYCQLHQTNLSEILIKIQKFPLKKKHFQMSARHWPFSMFPSWQHNIKKHIHFPKLSRSWAPFHRFPFKLGITPHDLHRLSRDSLINNRHVGVRSEEGTNHCSRPDGHQSRHKIERWDLFSLRKFRLDPVIKRTWH